MKNVYTSGVHWRLKETMDRVGITRYALHKHSTLSMGAIRSMYDGSNLRPDLSVLARVLDDLRKMTGQDLQLSDLLEYVPEDEVPHDS